MRSNDERTPPPLENHRSISTGVDDVGSHVTLSSASLPSHNSMGFHYSTYQLGMDSIGIYFIRSASSLLVLKESYAMMIHH